MKKKIRFGTQGRSTSVDEIKAQLMLPNKYVRAVGPFVLLAHVPFCKHSRNEPRKVVDGRCAHPHRGVATLTYILDGEVEHLDSLGNYAKVCSGGAHWMKAGKGIVHDEAINTDFKTKSLACVVQFWINLPAKHKCEDPNYLPLYENDIPKQTLNYNAGWIKILAGKYENVAAKIPCYSKQFLYHVHLEAGKQFSIVTESGLEYAAFLPKHSAVINATEFEEGEFIVFDSDGDTIEINNYSEITSDFILFGGEPYTEPIISEGTFVMNTPHEITQAYNDYYDGKYGTIK
jgi:redox-sensitive bicupin YhaK (pirin superfamily)